MSCRAGRAARVLRRRTRCCTSRGTTKRSEQADAPQLQHRAYDELGRDGLRRGHDRLGRCRPAHVDPRCCARARLRVEDLRRAARAAPSDATTTTRTFAPAGAGRAAGRRVDLEGAATHDRSGTRRVGGRRLAAARTSTPGGLAVPGRGGHALVAELVLEHPADRVAGQVVAELDVARDREVRHPLRHPPAQLLLGELARRPGARR